MRVIIAGGRDFTDYELLKREVDFILSKQKEIEILSGRCNRGVHTFTTETGIKVYGADGLGERYAQEKGYEVIPFPANWAEYGPAGGPIRNKQMAQSAQGLIIFWDGKSRGSRNMIDEAKAEGLRIHIVKY
jgi:hypothetical protein